MPQVCTDSSLSTGLPLTGSHQGGRKEPIGQPGRHQGGRKGSIGQPARHQGGRKEPFRQPGRHPFGPALPRPALVRGHLAALVAQIPLLPALMARNPLPKALVVQKPLRKASSTKSSLKESAFPRHHAWKFPVLATRCTRAHFLNRKTVTAARLATSFQRMETELCARAGACWYLLAEGVRKLKR